MLQALSQERDVVSRVPTKTNSAAPQRHGDQTVEIEQAERPGSSEALLASSSPSRAKQACPVAVSLDCMEPVSIEPAAEHKALEQAEPGVTTGEDTDSLKNVGARSEKGRVAGHYNPDFARDNSQLPQTAPADGTSQSSVAEAYTIAQMQGAPPLVVATLVAVPETAAAAVARVTQPLEKGTKAGSLSPVRVGDVGSENDKASAAMANAVREYPAETDGIAVELCALPERQNGSSAQATASASRSAATVVSQTEAAQMHNAGQPIATATDETGPFSVRHPPSASAKTASESAQATPGKAAGGSLTRRAPAQEGETSSLQSGLASTTLSTCAVVTAADGSDSSARGVHAGSKLRPGGADSHRESPTTMLTETRTVETHRSGVPQVEIGIQDATLGEVRVQAVLSRSGVMHIDVAGRNQATDAVLDQIAPLMHAAVAQQVEAHGQSHTIHVTAAAVPGGEGKAGLGSLTASAMAGVAQSGSFSSSLGNDAQPQQQQRRPQSLAYAPSVVHQEDGDTIVRSAFPSSSFFNNPHGQSGLSVRI